MPHIVLFPLLCLILLCSCFRYTNLKPCISRIPENGSGGSVPSWPARLHTPPDRLQTITFDSYIARKELFKAESRFWNEIVGGYIRALKWRKMKLRNVLDMRAGFGGYENDIFLLSTMSAHNTSLS